MSKFIEKREIKYINIYTAKTTIGLLSVNTDLCNYNELGNTNSFQRIIDDLVLKHELILPF